MRTGFYFAMVDFAPSVQPQSDVPPTPTSPIAPKSPVTPTPTSPTVTRRVSSSGDTRSPPRPDGIRRRRESSTKAPEVKEVRKEATIRGVRVSRFEAASRN